MVKILHSQCRRPGSIPGQGTRFPHAITKKKKKKTKYENPKLKLWGDKYQGTKREAIESSGY